MFLSSFKINGTENKLTLESALVEERLLIGMERK
jgi:hypothetical protein